MKTNKLKSKGRLFIACGVRHWLVVDTDGRTFKIHYQCLARVLKR